MNAPNIVIPIGKTSNPAETTEAMELRLKAEREANGGKTLAELEAERTANGGKTLAELEAEKAAKEDADLKALEDEAKSLNITVEELKAKKLNDIAPETIDFVVDGKTTTYKLDKDGNAIDDKGSIVYTADQIKEFSDNNDDQPNGATISDIAALSGIQVVKDGKPVVYENTIDGFAQREKDIKDLGVLEGKSAALAEFFRENPDFESMYKYKSTYGTLDNYTSFIDYSKVTLDKDNEEQLLQVIISAEIAKGSTKERAMKIANFSKSEGTVFQDATDSLTYLSNVQAKDIKAANDARQKEINDAIEAENKFYGVTYDENGNEKILNVPNSVYDMIVVKGRVGNVIIPKDGLKVADANGTIKHMDRRQIFDYIYTPVTEINGTLLSQAQVDEIKRINNKDNLISTYILNLLGGDASQLVEISKRNDNAKQVRTIVVKSNSASGSGSGSGKKTVIIPITKK